MDKLQAVLPPPTPKRSSHPRAAPAPRSTPPRPTKRNRLSAAATPNSEWKSPSTRPPMWSASPIAIVGNRQPRCATPATLHFDAMTPSPLFTTPQDSVKQSSKLRLSFGLSPIAFPSPEQVQAQKMEADGGDEEEKDAGTASNDDTLPLSSTEESAASVSPGSEKENEQQAQREGGRQQGSSSSHATADASLTSAAKKPAAPARSSIPRRQQAFMEAMEAEARSNDSFRGRSPTPSTILSLYQEAKRLGVTDPQAQWQYVQTLRQSDQKHKRHASG
ncbi:unnamed protein product [Phytophthora fragariaefolia]|uniref:Unnamed protein product n=1 Tax=Phytophthora fragariaefolia TaxID=1490495 RepID=A0A9W6YAA6_9STRA|nr:unnamed protein product [Phytophthora fragariaefolia]